MEDKIIEILQEIRPEFDFSGSEDFISDGFLDSFDIVQLVDALDEKFKISIERLSEFLLMNSAWISLARAALEISCD